MKLTVKIPKMGLTTEAVALVEWSKEVGDTVAAGETIAVIEADKASSEVQAPMAGTLTAKLVEAGSELAVGEPIAVIQT